MGRAWIICRRELWSAAVSPAMWAVLAAAWLLEGLLFKFTVLPLSRGDVSLIVHGAAGVWIRVQFLLAPLLCMRLLSEEKRAGTFEALMTAPVADHEVVLGKFLAVFLMHAVAALAPVVLSLLSIRFGGDPDPGQMAAAYLSTLGVGSLLLACGVFASAACATPVLAAFVGLVLGAALVAGPLFASLALPPDHWLVTALSYGAPLTHLEAGASGILDVNHVAYQTLVSALFLLFGTRVLEMRKWR
ncbi:MAG TPA: ABC transporter permease [Planctomycetota bacterium]|nr:ABC transporter permease [Planctomycetota bacterium]